MTKNCSYGYNGKEKDDEVKGSGNSYDFGVRIYDPRLGRWMSVDPLAKKYSGESPYSYAGNSPIIFIDLEGETKIVYTTTIDKNGKSTTVKKIDEKAVATATFKTYVDAFGQHKTEIVYDIVVFVTVDYSKGKDGKPLITASAKLLERSLLTKEDANKAINAVTPAMDKTAEAFTTAGIVVTGASVVTLQPEGVVVGGAAVETGAVIATVSTGLKVSQAIMNKDYNKAGALLALAMVEHIIGKKIDATPGATEAEKIIIDESAGKITEPIKEAIEKPDGSD